MQYKYLFLWMRDRIFHGVNWSKNIYNGKFYSPALRIPEIRVEWILLSWSKRDIWCIWLNKFKMNSLIFIWFSKWILYTQWVWRGIDNVVLIRDEIGVRDLIILIMNWLSNMIRLWVLLSGIPSDMGRGHIVELNRTDINMVNIIIIWLKLNKYKK